MRGTMSDMRVPPTTFQVQGPVQAEVFVVWLGPVGPELTGPCGAAPWLIEVGADEHPVEVVTRIIGDVVGPPRLVHSTSWRRVGSAVMLSFIAIIDAPLVRAMETTPIERAELARGTAAEASGTTHVSVVDAAGTCVSLTHSLGGSSGVVSPGLGFMYNNSMFGFDPRPGHPNSIAPGKGRITGMTPTIVYRGDDPILVIGAPGATRIVTAIAQVIVNHLDFGMSLPEAVLAPRFHAQGDAMAARARIPGSVLAEVRRQVPVTRAAGAHGGFAFVHAIGIDPSSRRLTGADDAGSDGMAIGV
ncbi:MAG: hypothetical protein FJ038_05970 [Chloroflexi bacterium]|nr:hypothetical protein [Chloroflexota bacterium]